MLLKRKPFILYLLTFMMILLCGHTSYAGNDDPGTGRLSGTDIPMEFYDTDSLDENVTRKERTKRPLRFIGAGTTTSPYTNETYTHRSDMADRPITHGIDVSEHQKAIDWNKVKAAGIEYAFIRVGYRGYTKGALAEDTYFRQNLAGATAAGVKVGVYIFSQAITVEEAREEANYLLERIKDYNITFPVVLDYEFSPNKGRLETANLSKADGTAICLEFCKTIQAAGYTPMVYANPDMLNNHLNATEISNQYLIWLANYTTQTSYTGKFDYWQYSSSGAVDGITGRVDMNFFYGTDLANATIAAIPDQSYTGKKMKPTLTATYKNQPLVADVDYTVEFTDNKKIGTATATVTGKGMFFGTQTLTFKIIPRQMSTVKVKKKATDYIQLKWTKDSSISGYQIYRSDAVDGKYKKIATITNKSTTTYKDKKLTNGQSYYYKIRSYKTVDNKKWYSAYSEIKRIHTKTGYTRNAVAKGDIILYSDTTTSSVPIITPFAGESMTVTYATKNAAGKKWYYVTYNKDGMSYNGFVQHKKVTITMVGKTTSKDINIRKSYSTSSKIITTVGKNKTLTILKTKKKGNMTWYQVEFKKKGTTYKGWISADFVKLK